MCLAGLVYKFLELPYENVFSGVGNVFLPHIK